MPEIDYVVVDLDVEWDGKVDLKELYSVLKSSLLRKKYDLTEKEYHITQTAEGDKLRIKWNAFRKVDDYTKFNIDFLVIGKRLKKVTTKNKVLVEGYLYFNTEAYLEKDYENVWHENATSAFVREVIDKFVLRSKFDKLSNELKDDAYSLRDSVKKFLNGIDY